jgi:hypothetical protein
VRARSDLQANTLQGVDVPRAEAPGARQVLRADEGLERKLILALGIDALGSSTGWLSCDSRFHR